MENLLTKNDIKPDRRDSIIVSGLKVFCEKGYDGTTVDDIVKKAGCSHGLFYHYFKSKKEVFDQVMKSRNHVTFEEIQEKINSISSYREKLKIIIHGMFGNLVHDENSSYYFFFFLTQCFNYNHSEKKPPLKPENKPIKPLPIIIEELFSEGIEKGEFSNKYTAKQCTELFLSIIQGASLLYAISPKDIKIKSQLPSVEFILDIFSKGDAR